MGTVWQASDEVLGRDVAVKEVILPYGLSDEERELQHRRTFREARTAARLAHPGVVTVYDVVEEDDRPWIVMELIKARSLDQVIKKEGTLPFRRAAVIGAQMLSALHAAHEAGVLHRDVKPSNVLLADDDRAVLTDFGIATATGDATLTATGLVMGSPAYIAPERARGKVAGPASDLWSLGITLYAMVEGRSPYDRPEPMASLIAIITDPVPRSEKAGPLWPVIEGLLDKNPDTRLTAMEAGRMLDEIVQSGTVTLPSRQTAESTRVLPEQSAETVAEMPRAEESGRPEKKDSGISLFDAPAMPEKRSGGGSGRATALAVTAIMLVTALIVGGLIWTQSGDGGAKERKDAVPTATPSGAKDEKTPTGTPSPEQSGPPKGFSRYNDPSGYSLWLPDGYTGPEVQDAQNHFFNGPGGVRIQIGQTDDPGESAIADWRDQESAGYGAAGFRGYSLVGIRPTGEGHPVPDTGDGSKSADWEFTFTGTRGGKMHGLNRGFVMGEKGYAILLMAPDETWAETWERLQPLYQGFKG
jgi:serine/threonine protein kinase